jgi:hypothetical protein
MKNRLRDYLHIPREPRQPSGGPSAPAAAQMQLARAVTDCIAEYPVASLVLAASLGGIIGWYLKRR